ncbi:MAG: serine/threonine protein kinase [Deltaproteobacteria bacterium]|nr:MAG: serine/threonine protein kinase [Deltaproteobacteria bacterium]
MSDLQADRPRTGTRLRYHAAGIEAPRPLEGVKKIGRYEIIRVLGKGAMGVVYKGRDPDLERDVAIKTIVAPDKIGRRGRSAYFERFQREAKAAAKMQHPAIVTIFDVGLDGEQPFMVLEYLPGESLADRLDRVRLPIQKAVNIARDLASALAFAHGKGIVHRDVKPANVLHAGDERWKLADFGIARMPNSDLTQAGIFMGTPGYAPPEAIREGLYTPQADVFAWGAVLYELLSGRIPYEGPDTPTTNGYVIRGTARSPRVYDPSIPQPLADVAMRALAGDPAERFKTAAEAEQALMAAWDRCLQEGLIHPSALARKEVPHAQVRGPFHGPDGASGEARAAAAPPSNATDSIEVRIESEDDVGDDDPTRIVIRERSAPPRPADDRTIEASDSIIIEDEEIRKNQELLERARATAERAAGELVAGGPAALQPRPAPNVWVWVVFVLSAVVVGGIAAFYLWRL